MKLANLFNHFLTNTTLIYPVAGRLAVDPPAFDAHFSERDPCISQLATGTAPALPLKYVVEALPRGREEHVIPCPPLIISSPDGNTPRELGKDLTPIFNIPVSKRELNYARLASFFGLAWA